MRILIADDQRRTRQSLKALLSTSLPGTEIWEAANGAEAMRLAEDIHPQLVLMDIRMPGVDGLDATRGIKSRWPEIKVLVLTSFAADDKVFPAVKAGALGYLLKDSSPEELVEAFHRVHCGEPSLEPDIARKVLQELSHPGKEKPTSDPLTGRELEVLRLISQGLSNKEIASKIFIAEWTVRTHVSNILGKLHLASRTQAALYALRSGLASIDDVPAAE